MMTNPLELAEAACRNEELEVEAWLTFWLLDGTSRPLLEDELLWLVAAATNEGGK